MARKLFSELGILTARKLRAPQNEEVAMGGAIIEDVTNYINKVVVKELGISPEYIEQEKTLQLEEIRGRVSLYHDDT